MAKIDRNRVTEVVLDFGVLGEQYCDCIYDWMGANHSSDPYQPPENEGAIIKDVLWFIDGHEVSIMTNLSPRELDLVADQIWDKNQ